MGFRPAGVAVKARKGEEVRGQLNIVSDIESQKIEVFMKHTPKGILVDLEKNIVKLDKKGRGTINFKIKIDNPESFEPLWIVVLGLSGEEEGEAYIGILPVNEQSETYTIRRAQKPSSAYAVGAPGFMEYYNQYVLSYRWRNGNERRGERLEISRSYDGLTYEEALSFTKDSYGYLSFEESDFAYGFEKELVFVYSADVKRTWKIFLTRGRNIEDLELPGMEIVNYAKDPAVLYDRENNLFILVYSNCRMKGHDLSVAVTEDFSDLRIITNSIVYNQFIDQGNSWARYHIHAGCIRKSGGFYALFYDALPAYPSCFGSGWLGIAISKDLKKWIDLTSSEPIWRGEGIDRTFRYVSVHASSHEYFLYAEVEEKSGNKNLLVFHESFEE